MMQIPLTADASQILNVVLNSQNVQLHLFQKSFGLFVDVNSNGVDISVGVLALDRNPIIRNIYNGFSGQLMFFDTQGKTDPYYTGLADRYVLAYLTDDEYAQLQQ